MKNRLEWLISKRQEAGLSQLELAQCLGKPAEYVEHIEKGLYVLELIEYLHYCQALNVSPNEGIQLIDLAFTKE